MKKLVVFLILIIFPELVAADIMINEIMYNPEGDDNNKEFIEIYHTEQINLTNWVIEDISSNDALTLLKYVPSNYSLIVEEGFDYSEISASVYSAGTTIGNNLGNDGDSVYLYDYTNLIDAVTYDDSYADGNGKSLELVENEWIQSLEYGGTPGRANTGIKNASIKDFQLTVYLGDEIYINVLYDDLFKLKVNYKDNCSEKDSAVVSYNIIDLSSNIIKQDSFTRENIGCSAYSSTGNFTPLQAGNFTICGLITSASFYDSNPTNDYACKNFTVIDPSNEPCNISINITTEKMLYDNKERIKFYNNLNDEFFPYKIEYWIEDLFGNIIKKKINTTNTNQKSYTPNIDEEDRVFLIKNEVYVSCNDFNSSDNAAEKLIIIKGSETSHGEGSSISIGQIYDLGSDNKAKFGQTIRVKLAVYKGDTTRESIKLWIEKDDERISKESKTNVYTKYTSYDLTLPVQIKPNCNDEFDDGEYDIIADGLGVSDTKKLEVEDITDSLCEEKIVYIETEEKTIAGKLEYELVDFPEEVEEGKEFTIRLRLTNNDDSTHKLELWSYVYRGNKCYSGEREENKKSIILSESESKLVSLKDKVLDAETGDYKLKIMIRQDNQKTTKDITKTMDVISVETVEEGVELKESGFEQDLFLESTRPEDIILESKKEPRIVYESSTIKMKNLVVYFILILLTIFCVILIWKR